MALINRVCLIYNLYHIYFFKFQSVSSEESISSSRINRYLEPKKKKKEKTPWWMQDDDDNIGTGLNFCENIIKKYDY